MVHILTIAIPHMTEESWQPLCEGWLPSNFDSVALYGGCFSTLFCMGGGQRYCKPTCWRCLNQHCHVPDVHYCQIRYAKPHRQSLAHIHGYRQQHRLLVHDSLWINWHTMRRVVATEIVVAVTQKTRLCEHLKQWRKSRFDIQNSCASRARLLIGSVSDMLLAVHSVYAAFI